MANLEQHQSRELFSPCKSKFSSHTGNRCLHETNGRRQEWQRPRKQRFFLRTCITLLPAEGLLRVSALRLYQLFIYFPQTNRCGIGHKIHREKHLVNSFYFMQVEQRYEAFFEYLVLLQTRPIKSRKCPLISVIVSFI